MSSVSRNGLPDVAPTSFVQAPMTSVRTCELLATAPIRVVKSRSSEKSPGSAARITTSPLSVETSMPGITDSAVPRAASMTSAIRDTSLWSVTATMSSASSRHHSTNLSASQSVSWPSSVEVCRCRSHLRQMVSHRSRASLRGVTSQPYLWAAGCAIAGSHPTGPGIAPGGHRRCGLLRLWSHGRRSLKRSSNRSDRSRTRACSISSCSSPERRVGIDP